MLFLVAFLFCQSPELSGISHTDAVPADFAAAVAAKIAPGGIRASVRGNALTFWWVKDLAMKSSPPSWSAVPEGTLVGAVKIEKDFRDTRGRVIKAGSYTLRYGIQPANGDHLGVSPFREFLLLSPAKQDAEAAPPSHDGLVDLSKQTIGGSHPAVWSLDPPVATDAALTVRANTELELKALVMEVPVTGGTLRFGLVLVGKIEA